MIILFHTDIQIEETRMALSAHLEELNSKHLKLDEKIRAELKHPLPDTLRISKLKKQNSR